MKAKKRNPEKPQSIFTITGGDINSMMSATDCLIKIMSVPALDPDVYIAAIEAFRDCGKVENVNISGCTFGAP